MAKGSLSAESIVPPSDRGSAVVGATNSPVSPAPPLTPTQKLKNLMHSDSWTVTQSFVQWGQVWENCRVGALTPYNEDSRMVMLAPFTFFNASPPTIGFMFSNVIPIFMDKYGQYVTDEIYANVNPMPWLVLESFAPAFAKQDMGFDAMIEARKLIREMRDSGQLPLEEPKQPAEPRQPQRASKQPNGAGHQTRAGQVQRQGR